MKRLAAIAFLLAGACAGETIGLEYGELVHVIVRVEDFQGPLTLLFSAPDGNVFAVETVDAPIIVERDVPKGSAVSTHFSGVEVQSQNVFSVGNLEDGDDVVLRPWRWRINDRWIEIGTVEGASDRSLAVDYGCGGFLDLRGDDPRRFTIADECMSDPFHVVFMFTDDRSIAVRDVPLAEIQSIAAPRLEEFVQRPQTTSIELRGSSARRHGSLFVEQVIGLQRFGAFEPAAIALEEGNRVDVSLAPLHAEVLSVRTVLEGDGDMLVIDRLVDPADPSLDIDTDLPAITEVVVEEGSVSWRSDHAPSSTSATVIQYGAPAIASEHTVRAWFVIARPASEGTWHMPDLPAELSDWQPDMPYGAVVSHYALPDEGGVRDVFPKLFSISTPSTYVTRTAVIVR